MHMMTPVFIGGAGRGEWEATSVSFRVAVRQRIASPPGG
jgi:hypothetical protein